MYLPCGNLRRKKSLQEKRAKVSQLFAQARKIKP
jgi:hypothetical protein